jgi:hypothetical protein
MSSISVNQHNTTENFSLKYSPQINDKDALPHFISRLKIENWFGCGCVGLALPAVLPTGEGTLLLEEYLVYLRQVMTHPSTVFGFFFISI